MQEDREEAEESTEATQTIIRNGERMLEEQLREIAEHTKRRTIEADQNRFVTNAWLKRTGWAQHLAGLDREQLIALLQLPNKEETIPEEDEIEEGLVEACKAT